jgi:hypothetical protein
MALDLVRLSHGLLFSLTNVFSIKQTSTIQIYKWVDSHMGEFPEPQRKYAAAREN